MAISNLYLGISITTSENICINLLYESHVNLSFPVSLAMASAVVSFNPRLRTVSIIPGIDIAAPDLTETKSGFFSEPNFLPAFDSNFFILSSISRFKSSQSIFPLL